MIYRNRHPACGGNGSPEHPQDASIKSENKVFNMGSVMIIFLIAHLVKKDQAYTSLFSSALKEGIRDTFGQVTHRSDKDSAKENINAHDK